MIKDVYCKPQGNPKNWYKLCANSEVEMESEQIIENQAEKGKVEEKSKWHTENNQQAGQILSKPHKQLC